MQMRKTFNTTNKKLLAKQHLDAAEECFNAGFKHLADLNWEMSLWLEPPAREDEEYE